MFLIQNMRIDVILFSIFVNLRESTYLWSKNELWNCETW